MDFITGLEIGPRAERVLRQQGIDTPLKLLELDTVALSKMKGIGAGTIHNIRHAQREVKRERAEMRFRRSGGYAFPGEVGRGMTLRQWYAGLALQGLLSNKELSSAVIHQCDDTVVNVALELADALIKAERESIPAENNSYPQE